MQATETREFYDTGFAVGQFRVLVERWKIVLIGGLCLFAAAASFIFATERPVYTSRMVAPLNARMLGLLKTEAVFDSLLQQAQSGEASYGAARRDLEDRIVVSPELSPGSGLYSISVMDSTPEGAQQTLNQVMTDLLNLSKPVGSLRSAMQQQLESLNDALAHLKKLSDRLAGTAEGVKAADEGEMYTRAFAHLVSDIGAKEAEIRALEDELGGVRLEDIIVRPTLPAGPDPSDFIRKLILAALASFALAGLLVVVMTGLRRLLWPAPAR